MASTDLFPERLRLDLLIAFGATALLTACSVTGPRSSPLPQDGKTINEVYKEHMSTEGFGAASAEPRRQLQAPEGTRSGARVDQVQEVQPGRKAGLMPAAYAEQIQPMQQRFQRLPNPDLVMYVHPHLAKGRYPVPGYLTVFPMYEAVEYALPGEVGPTRGAMADVPPLRNPLSAEFDMSAEPERAAGRAGSSASSSPSSATARPAPTRPTPRPAVSTEISAAAR